MLLDRSKGLGADNMLDFAGVRSGNLGINTQLFKKLRKHGVTFVGALGNLFAKLGRVERAVLCLGLLGGVVENRIRSADAGL